MRSQYRATTDTKVDQNAVTPNESTIVSLLA